MCVCVCVWIYIFIFIYISLAYAKRQRYFASLKMNMGGEQDSRRVGGYGVHLSEDASGIHLQTQKFMQNTS